MWLSRWKNIYFSFLTKCHISLNPKPWQWPFCVAKVITILEITLLSIYSTSVKKNTRRNVGSVPSYQQIYMNVYLQLFSLFQVFLKLSHYSQWLKRNRRWWALTSIIFRKHNCLDNIFCTLLYTMYIHYIHIYTLYNIHYHKGQHFTSSDSLVPLPCVQLSKKIGSFVHWNCVIYSIYNLYCI